MAEPGVLSLPGFRRLWTASTVSGLGSPVTMLAVQTLVLLGLHGTAADVGLVTAARWLPYLLLGIVVGAVVDRHPRRPIMVATDAGLGVLLLAVPALWFTHLLTLPVLAAVMAAYGLLTLYGDAASQAFVPRVVPGPRLQEAHVRFDQSYAVAQTAGPAIAGAVVAVLGAALTVVVDAVSYLASAVLVRGIEVDEPPARGRGDRPRLRHEIGEGLRWVYRQPRLGSLAVLTHAWFVCNAMLAPVLAALVLLGLGASPFALGVIGAGAGVGTLVGASVSTRVGRRLDAGPTIVLSNVFATLGTALVAAGAIVPVPVALALVALTGGMSLHGFSIGLSNSHEMSYRQLITPDALQARTNTTMRSVNRAMVVIAAPLGGLLADRAGYGTALVVVSVGFGLVTLAMLLGPVWRASYADAAA